jgi:hypothetical protein
MTVIGETIISPGVDVRIDDIQVLTTVRQNGISELLVFSNSVEAEEPESPNFEEDDIPL